MRIIPRNNHCQVDKSQNKILLKMKKLYKCTELQYIYYVLMKHYYIQYQILIKKTKKNDPDNRAYNNMS